MTGLARSQHARGRRGRSGAAGPPFGGSLQLLVLLVAASPRRPGLCVVLKKSAGLTALDEAQMWCVFPWCPVAGSSSGMSIVVSAAASVVLFFLCENISGHVSVVLFKTKRMVLLCPPGQRFRNDSLVLPPAQFGSLVMLNL